MKTFLGRFMCGTLEPMLPDYIFSGYTRNLSMQIHGEDDGQNVPIHECGFMSSNYVIIISIPWALLSHVGLMV